MNFFVLKCFHCATYQVHQSKKTKKWTCKVCGFKQSIVKVFFEGTSHDCRKIVQESNLKKKDQEVFRYFKNEECKDYNHDGEDPRVVQLIESSDLPHHVHLVVSRGRNLLLSPDRNFLDCAKRSKWETFKALTKDELSGDEESSLLHHTQFCYLKMKNSDSEGKDFLFHCKNPELSELKRGNKRRKIYCKNFTDTTELFHKKPVAIKGSKWDKFR